MNPRLLSSLTATGGTNFRFGTRYSTKIARRAATPFQKTAMPVGLPARRIFPNGTSSTVVTYWFDSIPLLEMTY